MKIQEIKFKNFNNNYSILIGDNILKILPKKIKLVCPKVKKIALIFDSQSAQVNFKKIISKYLKKYEIIKYNFKTNEKVKSLKSARFFFK